MFKFICPKYSTVGSTEGDFLLLSNKPEDCNQLSTGSRLWRCSSGGVPVIKILSRYTQVWGIHCNKLSIVCWNMAGADTPKDVCNKIVPYV